jgi:hypothetical protein
MAKYFVCVREGESVGPHELDDLRAWLACGVMKTDWFACAVGSQEWLRMCDFPMLMKTSTRSSQIASGFLRPYYGSWLSDPPTEAQLERLHYFDIPFSENGLSKAKAAALIDAFALVDPDRLKQYNSRPHSEAQAARIFELGGNPRGLTYEEARYEIRSLQWERDQEKERNRKRKRAGGPDDILDMMMLNDRLLHPDTLEVCCLGNVSIANLRILTVALNQHVPNWRSIGKRQLGEILNRHVSTQNIPERMYA